MSVHDAVSDVGFDGDSFVVKSALVGPDYAIKTGAGKVLLHAERRFFAEGLTYEYSDESDEVRFRFEATDGAKDRFHLVDVTTDQPLATLRRSDDDSWYRWTLETDETVVEIVGETGSIPIFEPQKGRHMAVRSPAGEDLGRVDRRLLSIRFTFDVELPGLDRVARAAVVLAVPLVYDAMREQSSMWEQ